LQENRALKRQLKQQREHADEAERVHKQQEQEEHARLLARLEERMGRMESTLELFRPSPSATPDARATLERVSGQSKVPTLDWHGQVLADFSTDELVPFLRSRNVKLEDS
jgi:hypothetical protein